MCFMEFYFFKIFNNEFCFSIIFFRKKESKFTWFEFGIILRVERFRVFFYNYILYCNFVFEEKIEYFEGSDYKEKLMFNIR